MKNIRHHTRRFVIAGAGGLVILIGLILVPYPGPGWLVVFSGFAILATEFSFAQKTLEWLRGKYDGWAAWLQRQSWPVRLLVLSFTGLVVVLTLWLLNTFGLASTILHLHQPWLVSPLFR